MAHIYEAEDRAQYLQTSERMLASQRKIKIRKRCWLEIVCFAFVFKDSVAHIVQFKVSYSFLEIKHDNLQIGDSS